jgi:SAM-dependent methyltransferase
MSDPRLYNQLAWIWEIIVSKEEYLPEVEFLKKMIRKHKKTLGNDLLDVGCGAGHHDLFLKREYKIVGLDRHEEMLKYARRRNPEVAYIAGDMRRFKLHKKFDVVTAMDMIMYNLNYSDLEKTLKNFYDHLKIGGVSLFFFEEMKKTFEQNKTSVSKRKRGKMEVIVIENDYDEDENDTEYESILIFLIRKEGKLQVEVDKHQIGIFELDKVLEILDKLNFKTKLYEMDFQEKEYKKKGPFFVCQKS